ncbi:MAG: M23 family metallopeptidase [Candidatus Moranbacteria bacterium]|nr:M23 family metallopeptidase [Candidatus Moranbacteria bacterium]
MAYPHTHELGLPLKDYRVNGSPFGKDCTYEGVNWGIHLGEDVICEGGTKIFSIGRGRVVHCQLHAGTKEKGNWGWVAIIAHKNPKTKKVFFSICGHMGRVFVSKGDTVELGQKIGTIGASNTPENGFWETPHLHFAIFTGPWQRKILPGYFKPEHKRTKLEWWVSPKEFIERY